MIRKLLAVVIVAGGSCAAWADEAAIRKGIEEFLGADGKVEGISPPGVLGLHEVHIATRQGPHILYSDAQGRFIIRGDVIEAKTKTNITAARLRKLNTIRFDDLPLAQAFKIVHGKGTRVLAYFADPRCPHCKRFDQELAQLDDVSVYVFLLPIIAKDFEGGRDRGVVLARPRPGLAGSDAQDHHAARPHGLRHAARQEHRARPQVRHQRHADAGVRRRPAHVRRDARGTVVPIARRGGPAIARRGGRALTTNLDSPCPPG